MAHASTAWFAPPADLVPSDELAAGPPPADLEAWAAGPPPPVLPVDPDALLDADDWWEGTESGALLTTPSPVAGEAPEEVPLDAAPVEAEPVDEVPVAAAPVDEAPAETLVADTFVRGAVVSDAPPADAPAEEAVSEAPVAADVEPDAAPIAAAVAALGWNADDIAWLAEGEGRFDLSETPALATELDDEPMEAVPIEACDADIEAELPIGDEPAWADALEPDPSLDAAVLEAEIFGTPSQDAAPAPAADAPAPPRPPKHTAPVLTRGVTTAERRPAATHPVVRARVASILARAVAWAVDGMVLGTVVAGVLAGAAHLTGGRLGLGALAHDPVLAGSIVLLTALLGLFYNALFTAVGGQTLGARLARIRILDRQGTPPSLARAFARAAAAAVGTVACLVGLAWVVLDERGQALHDHLASTYAVEAG